MDLPKDAKVLELLSPARLAPYLASTDGDGGKALELYAWSCRTASAAFEVVGHLEVLLRNAIDRELAHHYREPERGIPWFLLPTPGGDNVADAVEAVRARLRPLGQESRHQVVAGLSFGFWTGLLGPRYEELWRQAIHRSFPHGSGQRKQVATALEAIRKFRNRLAHHDSMVNVDVPFEVRRLFTVAGFIDPLAREWLESCSRVMDAYAERPVTVDDTVVVPAREAWPLYQDVHAYVCQSGRTFRPVDRIAFYADREVKPEVPRILDRLDDVEWTDDEVTRLAASSERQERRLAEVMRASREAGWREGRYQVFFLSRPGDARHRSLAAPLEHSTTGRGSAFVQRQRYTSLHALETATTTADL